MCKTGGTPCTPCTLRAFEYKSELLLITNDIEDQSHAMQHLALKLSIHFMLVCPTLSQTCLHQSHHILITASFS